MSKAKDKSNRVLYPFYLERVLHFIYLKRLRNDEYRLFVNPKKYSIKHVTLLSLLPITMIVWTGYYELTVVFAALALSGAFDYRLRIIPNAYIAIALIGSLAVWAVNSHDLKSEILVVSVMMAMIGAGWFFTKLMSKELSIGDADFKILLAITPLSYSSDFNIGVVIMATVAVAITWMALKADSVPIGTILSVIVPAYILTNYLF